VILPGNWISDKYFTTCKTKFKAGKWMRSSRVVRASEEDKEAVVIKHLNEYSHEIFEQEAAGSQGW
jgi:hypothetical protein